jgi:hypothetical protein
MGRRKIGGVAMMGHRAEKTGWRSFGTANSISVLISGRYLLEGFLVECGRGVLLRKVLMTNGPFEIGKL